MAYPLSFNLALGAGNAGLTLEAVIVNTEGVAVSAPVSGGFVEIGVGNYLWTGSLPTGHRGGVIFRVSPSGSVKAFSAVNPEEAEYLDQKVSTISSASSMGSGDARVTIILQDTEGNRLPNLRVTVFNYQQTYPLTARQTTDTSGRVFANLEAGTTCWIVVGSDQNYETLTPQAVEVTGDETVTLTLTPIVQETVALDAVRLVPPEDTTPWRPHKFLPPRTSG